jgi:hypothetical protein
MLIRFKIATQTAVKHTDLSTHAYYLTHWHTQPAVRRAETSMPLLLILALCQ